jgi:prepilin-type N-terminal cleavage/methylation domain-containing protein
VLASTNKSHGGYTLTELVIAISLIGIISVSIFTIFLNYFTLIARNNIIIDMTVDSQSLLRTAVEELRYGAGVRDSNTIADSNQPSGWNTSNSNFVIIIAVPAVDSARNYIIDPLTGGPYMNELVYFKQDNTLYKRILANPSASGNSLTTSCPAASASTSCPADRKLMDFVEDMVFTLYDQDNAVTVDPLLARSIKIDLSMERETFGQPLELQNSIRITLRNTF